MPTAGEIFYNNCHNRTQIINEILNEIEIQEHSMPVAGELFLEHHNINIISTKRLYLSIADFGQRSPSKSVFQQEKVVKIFVPGQRGPSKSQFEQKKNKKIKVVKIS